MPESTTPRGCGRTCGGPGCTACHRRALTRGALTPIGAGFIPSTLAIRGVGTTRPPLPVMTGSAYFRLGAG